MDGYVNLTGNNQLAVKWKNYFTSAGDATQEWPNRDLGWKDRVTAAAVFDVIAFVGLFTNGLPIFLTVFTELRKNSVNIMVANISVVGLMNCFVVFGHSVYTLYRERLPNIGCAVLGALQMMMCLQVLMFPPCLSVNRYMAIFHSHLYDRWFTRGRTWVVTLLSWFVCALVALVFTLGGHGKYDLDNEHCCVVTKGSLTWSVFYCVVVVGFVATCDSTVLYFNVRIFKYLRDHAVQQTLSVNVVKQHREMFFYLIAELVLPLISDSAFQIARLVYVERQTVFFRWFFYALLLLHRSLRGVVSVMLLNPYRQQCRKMWKALTGRQITSTVAPMPAQHNEKSSRNSHVHDS